MAAGRIVVPPYFPARNRNGDLISGALLYVYVNESTTSLATIYSDFGLTTPAANPAEANTSGQFPPIFAEAGTEVAPVLYRVAVTTSDGGSPGNAFVFDNYRPSVDYDTATAALAEAAAASAGVSADEAQQALDDINDAIQAAQDADGIAAVAGAIAGQIAGQAAAEAVVATKAEKATTLAALANVGSAEVVVVTPLGSFRWVAGNQSANVTADPQKGIWVAPVAAPSGSVGAWRRIYNGPIDPSWFGGQTSSALQAALDYAKAVDAGATIAPLGEYTMTATVRYEGGMDKGVIFDGSGATFLRSSDYGRTFYVSGLSSGEPLERTSWLFGRLEDTNDSMTYANSRCHVTFDNVNFLEWGVGEIVGGCSGVELLGCASTKPVGKQFWRMQGDYKGASSFAVRVGRSEIPASAGIYGGDHHGLGAIDAYCGRGVLNLVGSTSGSSATVTVNSTAGIVIGALITGHGLNGNNQYALIPQGTTVVGVGVGTITLSTPVNLPPATPLAAFYPTLAYGVLIEACDGLWSDNELIHSIFAGTSSVAIIANTGNPVWNVRLRFMADWAPGNSFSITGTGEVRDGYADLHHPYNGQFSVVTTATLVNFTVFSPDQTWSRRGFTFGDTVSATQMRIEGAGGFSELLFRHNGVTRYNQYVTDGTASLQARDSAGAVIGPVWTVDQAGKLVTVGFPLQHSAASVADLGSAPFTGYYDGTEILCYDCRVLTAGGALQGPGAGTGGKLWKNGGNWYVVGTNVIAQA